MSPKSAQSPPPLSFRPPVVAILGHVDHGKTSLLDYLKKTRLVAREKGGITQGIGAYQVESQGRKLTFIDTPGHAAFSKMRSRGASVADLAVLVVAADDGVMPQTVESIKHIIKAQIPFVVAINKIDKPGVTLDKAKAGLTEHQVFVEGYGGNTPVVGISAKTGQGVSELLENLTLLADLEELKLTLDGPVQAVVIEAKKDRQAGNEVSVIVTSGKLQKGENLYLGETKHKVRAIFNEQYLPIDSASAGEPALILGLTDLPQVGELLSSEPRTEVERDETDTVLHEELPSVSQKLNLILKANSLGSIEAIKQNIAPELNIVMEGTGDINESDILLASSTGSLILGFGVKSRGSATRLAELEGVTIKNFELIYELLEYLEKKVLRLLEPTIDEEELGRAKVKKVFEINDDKVAGCLVETGQLSQGDTVHLLKKDGESKNAKIKSLRIGKEELKKVTAGEECGILLFPRLDIREKDIIISYKKIKTDED